MKKCIKRRSLITLNIVIGIVVIALYIINKFYLNRVLNILFFRFYFNDMLGGILIVTYSNVILQFSNYKDALMKLHNILIFTLVVGLFWEYFTPLYYRVSVSDPLDVVAYMLGGVIYYLIIRTNKNR